jgi:phospholipase/carboxylesterase
VTSRRNFARSLTAAILLSNTAAAQRVRDNRPNRLRARAIAPVKSPAAAGLHTLGAREKRDSLVYIPESASKFEKAPLMVSLHGATQNAERGLALLQSLSDEHGFVLLAPASADGTWEVEGAWGADLENVDLSLALSFGLRNIDPSRIAISGFSDGATYALALGLSNGDLFNATLAFSPGYLAAGARAGKPPVFISHGTADPIFPIDQCGRAIAANLKRADYRVTFREFEGRHTLPPAVAGEAMEWLMKAAPLGA